jgi:hypothetical protein
LGLPRLWSPCLKQQCGFDPAASGVTGIAVAVIRDDARLRPALAVKLISVVPNYLLAEKRPNKEMEQRLRCGNDRIG